MPGDGGDGRYGEEITIKEATVTGHPSHGRKEGTGGVGMMHTGRGDDKAGGCGADEGFSRSEERVGTPTERRDGRKVGDKSKQTFGRKVKWR